MSHRVVHHNHPQPTKDHHEYSHENCSGETRHTSFERLENTLANKAEDIGCCLSGHWPSEHNGLSLVEMDGCFGESLRNMTHEGFDFPRLAIALGRRMVGLSPESDTYTDIFTES